MFVIKIKNLKLFLNNKIFLMRKKFKPFVPKSKTNKLFKFFSFFFK